VSQKFALAIDLQYETVSIGIVPEISADVTAENLGGEFAFDQRLLDNIFQELEPPGERPQRSRPSRALPGRPTIPWRSPGTTSARA